MAKQARETTPEARKGAGLFLKSRREEVALTQLEIAKAVGFEYPQMVSQVEVGKARVPPGRYVDYAKVLKMDPKDFCRELLRHYDPEMWKLLYGNAGGC